MATEETTKTTGRRILTGTVVSDKMDKTVTVEVSRTVKHRQYRKYVRRTATYKAHDENNEYKLGDIVKIEESRPLSKTKRWIVLGRQGA